MTGPIAAGGTLHTVSMGGLQFSYDGATSSFSASSKPLTVAGAPLTFFAVNNAGTISYNSRVTFAEVKVCQRSSSECRMVVAQLGNANVTYDVALDGRGAASTLHGVFVETDSEHSVFDLTTRHNVSDCRSESMVKGVVSGRATGEFHGLVYVAQDAQRTDARQQSRNVEIGNLAHIIAKPQLEIYADDVKCSHGATVGQIDDDAILYMRQRGLSEQTARRMLLEGFVGDVVQRCDVCDELCEALAAEVESKLNRL